MTYAANEKKVACRVHGGTTERDHRGVHWWARDAVVFRPLPSHRAKIFLDCDA